ncbi:hypothetical protein [Novosphingobium sp. 9]|uniref:hypothetical protein n=1 Tax=Novosphingobium sp. 9 TaxID=2025349 RepID=UPI0021B69431|nr:hypothetical protein [Novosphingobium sp. 9]
MIQPAFGQENQTVQQADSAVAQNLLSGSLVPKTSRERCSEPGRPGEIIVCAPDKDKYRIPSTTDEDPTGKKGTDDGQLHAPNVSGLPDCSKRGSCIGIGKTPEPVYMIDLKSIPQAPADSDADKIARGEMKVP